MIQPIAPAATTAADTNSAKALLDTQLRKRAVDFEAMMLEQLIAPVQKSFASAGGKSEDAGQDTIQGLGAQFLAQGMAAQGGVGLAQMVVSHLSPKDSR